MGSGIDRRQDKRGKALREDSANVLFVRAVALRTALSLSAQPRQDRPSRSLRPTPLLTRIFMALSGADSGE
jgi:hypothetical protein